MAPCGTMNNKVITAQRHIEVLAERGLGGGDLAARCFTLMLGGNVESTIGGALHNGHHKLALEFHRFSGAFDFYPPDNGFTTFAITLGKFRVRVKHKIKACFTVAL